MEIDDIYNKALLELKASENGYLMFDEFSFMKEAGIGSGEFSRIRILLKKSQYFEIHAKLALMISNQGYEIIRVYGSWNKYIDTLEKQDLIRIDKEKKELESLIWSTKVSRFQAKTKLLPYFISAISLVLAAISLYVAMTVPK